MAKTQRLFRNIWRINAVIILVAGIFLALAGLAGLYEIVSYITRDRGVQNVAVEGRPNLETRWWIGSFNVLRGVPAAIAPYRREQSYREQRYNLSSYAKNAGSIVDYVIVSTTDGSSWRMRDERKGIVAQRWLLPLGTTKPVALIAVSAISADTNGDSRITLGDNKHLIVAAPDGSLKKQIADNIEQVLLFVLQDGALRLIYREAETERLVLRVIDPKSFAVLSENEIAAN